MSQNLDNYLIPRLLDAPAMILWFEADTALIGSSGLYLGFIAYALFGAGSLQIILLAVMTIALARVYSSIKAEGQRGFIGQLSYWYLPGSNSTRPIKPEIREYRG